MSWESLAAVDVFQLERNEALLDSLYTFLEGNELTAAEVTRIEPAQLAKTLSVVQCIMKVLFSHAYIPLYTRMTWLGERQRRQDAITCHSN